VKAWVGGLAIVLGLIGSVSMTGAAQGDASSVDDATALSASLAYLQTHAPELGIRDAHNEFRLRQVVRDSLGQIHVRLDQVYRRVPVYGKQLIAHLDEAGVPHSVTGAYLAGIDVSTQPSPYRRLEAPHSNASRAQSIPPRRRIWCYTPRPRAYA